MASEPATHLLVPFASASDPACRALLPGLPLPHLTALLAELQPVHTDSGTDHSLSAPHERALAQAIGQARLFNMHPVGKMEIDERLNGLLGDDGITNCGNAQNCVQVCPMSLPLTKAIYETNRDITVNALFGWLKK